MTCAFEAFPHFLMASKHCSLLSVLLSVINISGSPSPFHLVNQWTDQYSIKSEWMDGHFETRLNSTPNIVVSNFKTTHKCMASIVWSSIGFANTLGWPKHRPLFPSINIVWLNRDFKTGGKMLERQVVGAACASVRGERGGWKTERKTGRSRSYERRRWIQELRL